MTLHFKPKVEGILINLFHQENIKILFFPNHISQMSIKLSVVFIIHNLLTTEGREMNTK